MPSTRANSNRTPKTATTITPTTTNTPAKSLKRTFSLVPIDTVPPPDTVSKSKKRKTKMSVKDMSELRDMIGAMNKNIEQKIDDSRSTLESQFNNFAAQVKDEVQSIKQTVNEFQTKICHDIDSMSSTLKNHADRIDNTEDDIQRVQLSQDLRLIGFAVKENENLVDIFRIVAEEIGCPISANANMPTIERIPMKNHATGQMMLSPTILIHFASSRQKQSFYSAYLNKMPLDPTKLGLNAENRIVVGEHLTRKNAQLFKLALSHRKNNKLAQAFTENGIVKIRFAKGKNERTFTVRSNVELETLIAQYEVAMSQAHKPNNAPTNSTPTHTTTAPLPYIEPTLVTEQNLGHFIQLQQHDMQLRQQQQHAANIAATSMSNSTQPHQPQSQSQTPMQINNNA